MSIMECLQKYVPHVRKTTSVPVPGKSGEYEEVHHDFFHHILFGGDQLTKVRSEGAQSVRGNSPDKIGKLSGLVPVIEDWHAKQCLAGVSRTSCYGAKMYYYWFCIVVRCSGSDCTAKAQTWTVALYISFAI